MEKIMIIVASIGYYLPNTININAQTTDIDLV